MASKRQPRDYSEQTYASPFWIVRYPHRARFDAAVEAIVACRATRVLDYGAGDGHLLSRLEAANAAEIQVTAYEPIDEFARLIPERLGAAGSPVRVVRDLAELDGQYDAIVCLSVLEHMPLPERMKFYGVCEKHLAPGGVVIVDVPIEGGISIAIKEIGRFLLKSRESTLTVRQFLRALSGRIVFDAERFDPDHPGTWIHEHAGFDHRLLEAEMLSRFELNRRFPTPLRRVPALLGNQEMIYVLDAPKTDRRPSES